MAETRNVEGVVDAIRDMIQCAEVRPSANTLLVVRHLGGAIARVSETATAYANRKAATT